MKVHLIAWLCAPALMASAFGADTDGVEKDIITWDEHDTGTISGSDPIALSDVKNAIVKRFGPTDSEMGEDEYVFGNLLFQDITVNIDDTCTYVQYPEPHGGAPNEIWFGKNVVWVFDDPSITYADRLVSFTLYVPNEDYSSAEAGSLTINLTDNYLKGQSWTSKGGEGTVDAYYIPFMECQYFVVSNDDINVSGEFNVSVAGLNVGDETSDGFLYKGYVDSLEKLSAGEMGVIKLSTESASWLPEEDEGTWSGTLITLAAKPKAGVVGPPVVPEPATATLSLLALAGLAARRRRKA